MAPKGSKPSNGGNGGRIKFRFVDIEMENVNESITEGLRSLASALSRGPHPVSVRTTTSSGQVAAHALQTGAAVVVPDDIDDEVASEDEAVMEPAAQREDEGAAAVRTGNKPRKLRDPQFLHDVDLTTATTSLDDFIKQKNPIAINDKYLVIAQWFKEFMETPEVSVDHIYTGFESLGCRAQVPKDASQPLRSLKVENLMESGSSRGVYKINWNGTKAVAEMKPAE